MCELRTKKKYITCPECGRPLFRSSRAVCEIECCKCRQTIVILVKDGEVITFKSRRSKERII